MAQQSFSCCIIVTLLIVLCLVPITPAKKCKYDTKVVDFFQDAGVLGTMKKDLKSYVQLNNAKYAPQKWVVLFVQATCNSGTGLYTWTFFLPVKENPFNAAKIVYDPMDAFGYKKLQTKYGYDPKAKDFRDKDGHTNSFYIQQTVSGSTGFIDGVYAQSGKYSGKNIMAVYMDVLALRELAVNPVMLKDESKKLCPQGGDIRMALFFALLGQETFYAKYGFKATKTNYKRETVYDQAMQDSWDRYRGTISGYSVDDIIKACDTSRRKDASTNAVQKELTDYVNGDSAKKAEKFGQYLTKYSAPDKWNTNCKHYLDMIKALSKTKIKTDIEGVQPDQQTLMYVDPSNAKLKARLGIAAQEEYFNEYYQNGEYVKEYRVNDNEYSIGRMFDTTYLLLTLDATLLMFMTVCCCLAGFTIGFVIFWRKKGYVFNC